MNNLLPKAFVAYLDGMCATEWSVRQDPVGCTLYLPSGYVGFAEQWLKGAPVSPGNVRVVAMDPAPALPDTLAAPQAYKGHKHAALMALYAADAAENAEPWRLWEAWQGDARGWTPLTESPVWNPARSYRRKPRTIRIGAVDVPEPLRVAPEHWAVVYRVDLASPAECLRVNWTESDRTNLDAGILHATEQAAREHTRALIALSAAP